MCVILAVDEKAHDVKRREFEQAALANSDGYGLAWIENGRIKYMKKLKVTRKDANFRPPKPYVMHFRLATVGGNDKRLCHPFVVNRRSRPQARGTADEVLFHNGHLMRWEEYIFKAYSGIGRLPKGPYSDSRAVAMLLGAMGDNIFDLPGVVSGSRYLVFSPSGFSFYGSGWTQDKEDGIYRSNKMHMSSSYTAYTGHSNMISGNWTNPRITKVGEVCSHCKAEVSQLNLPRRSSIYCRSCELFELDNRPHDCHWCHDPLVMVESIEAGLCGRCREFALGAASEKFDFCRAQGCFNRLWIPQDEKAGYCVNHKGRYVSQASPQTDRFICAADGCSTVIYRSAHEVRPKCTPCSLHQRHKQLTAGVVRTQRECALCDRQFYTADDEEVVCTACKVSLDNQLPPPINEGIH